MVALAQASMAPAAHLTGRAVLTCPRVALAAALAVALTDTDPSRARISG